MSDTRPCTCAPDERPYPCQHKYALGECRKAHIRALRLERDRLHADTEMLRAECDRAWKEVDAIAKERDALKKDAAQSRQDVAPQAPAIPADIDAVMGMVRIYGTCRANWQGVAADQALDRIRAMLAAPAIPADVLELLREAWARYIKVGYGASHEDVAECRDFCARIDAVLEQNGGSK